MAHAIDGALVLTYYYIKHYNKHCRGATSCIYLDPKVARVIKSTAVLSQL